MEPEYQKVYFRGESMFVEVESRSEDGLHLMGKVANYPVNSVMHQYRFGDDVACHIVDYGDFKSWEPVHAVNPEPTNNPESIYTPEDVFNSAKRVDETE